MGFITEKAGKHQLNESTNVKLKGRKKPPTKNSRKGVEKEGRIGDTNFKMTLRRGEK